MSHQHHVVTRTSLPLSLLSLVLSLSLSGQGVRVCLNVLSLPQHIATLGTLTFIAALRPVRAIQHARLLRQCAQTPCIAHARIVHTLRRGRGIAEPASFVQLVQLQSVLPVEHKAAVVYTLVNMLGQRPIK